MLKNLVRLCAVGAVAVSLTAGALYSLPAQKKNVAAKGHGPIAWQKDMDKAQKQAAKEKKLIMVDFYADWCGPCKMMLDTTYKDKTVVKRSKEFVPLLIDIDKQPDLATKYEVEAIPTVVFLDSKGKVVSRALGYQNAKQFIDMMDKAKKTKL